MTSKSRNSSLARSSRDSSIDKKTAGQMGDSRRSSASNTDKKKDRQPADSKRSSASSTGMPPQEPSRRASSVSLASALSKTSSLGFEPEHKEGQALVDFLEKHIQALGRLKNRATFLQSTLIEEYHAQSVEKTLEYKMTVATIPKIEKQIRATKALRDTARCNWPYFMNWLYPKGDEASVNKAVKEMLKKAKTLDQALDYVESRIGEAAMTSLAGMGLPVTIIRQRNL